MRRFNLVRKEDVSGVSGTGKVAEGVEFHDGLCALHWFGKYKTESFYKDITQLAEIHGHEGRTVVEWID